MRSRRRKSSAGRVVRRLISLAILALPGGYHGGILAGIVVDDRHHWASVCDKCPRVQTTSEVQQSGVSCSRCGAPCTNLPLYRCMGPDCPRILVYVSQAKTRRGVECRGTTHVPEPRFTGTPDAGNSQKFDFAPDGPG